MEVLVDGRVGSNRPAFCECLREWLKPRLEEVGVTGEEVAGGRGKGECPLRGRPSLGDCGPVTERAAETAVDMVGREKFWRLTALLLLPEVKLV